MAVRSKKRRIAVITGTRADYGILKPVMAAIDRHPRLNLGVIVTGMHLLKRFGYTLRDVEMDGWQIDGRVRLQNEQDDVIGHSRGLGRAITRLTDIYADFKTEIVLVLGDRLEMFGAAAAATASQLVVGHIHSGDAAMGIQDEAYRFAISKLSHLHFAACRGSKQRLIQLGEDKFRIYQTGSPALDNLSKNICDDISVLNKWIGFDIREDYLIILQHPAGGTADLEEKRMSRTLRGSLRKGLKIIVLYPNCDPGFSGILRAAHSFCNRYNVPLLRNLPRDVYMGVLKRSRALVGNSSSGIIEASYLNVDVINIGPRQYGRDRGENVIDIDYGRASVAQAIEKILRRRNKKSRPSKIYGRGKSGEKIAEILAQIKLDQQLRQKKIAY
ncbi:MAG: UDP-N-acetylglucosamine 2-epimerase (hydrolyzing) [Sedimentisphaerales bacterium]|nr:UDP-N-acetylglucosamine 2-epimerase (hydrolyzing) [Sedimentisphaerales bacterium]